MVLSSRVRWWQVTTLDTLEEVKAAAMPHQRSAARMLSGALCPGA